MNHLKIKNVLIKSGGAKEYYHQYMNCRSAKLIEKKKIILESNAIKLGYKLCYWCKYGRKR